MIHATFIPTKFGWNQSMMRIETPAFEAELVLGSWRRNWQLFPGESTLLGIWPSSHQSGLSKCLEYLEYTWHIIRRFGGEGGMSIPTKARQFNTNESTKMIGQNRQSGAQNHDNEYKIMTKSWIQNHLWGTKSKTMNQKKGNKIMTTKSPPENDWHHWPHQMMDSPKRQLDFKHRKLSFTRLALPPVESPLLFSVWKQDFAGFFSTTCRKATTCGDKLYLSKTLWFHVILIWSDLATHLLDS